MLQSGNGGCARDGGKVVEKFVQRFAAFEIVQEILEGYARAAKHRGSTQDFGILHDNFAERRHGNSGLQTYFTSQVSPARRSLARSPGPRLAITSLICWFMTSS